MAMLRLVVVTRQNRRDLRLAVGVFAAFWLTSAVGVATGAASQEAPCANFGQVSTGLYRGAEPGERCLAHLAKLGIRMVVNLRDEEDTSDREQSEAVTLGMRYLNIPMSGIERPSVAEVQQVLTVIRASENQPVFVHCKRGRDRTGVIVAAYRMVHEGWAAERAVQEAKGFGLAWWQFGMKKFMRDFGANASLQNGRHRSQGRTMSSLPSNPRMNPA